jgi:hypothetical protein
MKEPAPSNPIADFTNLLNLVIYLCYQNPEGKLLTAPKTVSKPRTLNSKN